MERALAEARSASASAATTSVCLYRLSSSASSAWCCSGSTTTHSVDADADADADARRAPVLLHELGDLDPVGADGPEALGLGEDREHQPRVVGLAVVEEIAGGRRAARQGRHELDHGQQVRRVAGVHDEAARTAGQVGGRQHPLKQTLA